MWLWWKQSFSDLLKFYYFLPSFIYILKFYKSCRHQSWRSTIKIIQLCGTYRPASTGKHHQLPSLLRRAENKNQGNVTDRVMKHCTTWNARTIRYRKSKSPDTIDGGLKQAVKVISSVVCMCVAVLKSRIRLARTRRGSSPLGGKEALKSFTGRWSLTWYCALIFVLLWLSVIGFDDKF